MQARKPTTLPGWLLISLPPGGDLVALSGCLAPGVRTSGVEFSSGEVSVPRSQPTAFLLVLSFRVNNIHWGVGTVPFSLLNDYRALKIDFKNKA